MRTNLIQSYLNGTTVSQQYNSDKAAKDFDVHKELSNRTFIKPLPSNAKLLKPGLFDMPSVIVKDIKYDWNAFKHAVKGEANDHELGRLNDVGMKLGGLAIASYLFTKKQTPMTKIFEFIGLASFFGAMDLWPKLFLQIPAYIVHGFNIRQKYEDNYGRKKLVFQDHQFIPWDAYSDKEINKIGDRLGVPKDIPNRREFIQEKMRKIALQNNTMWMLTAGFATPIMSALICNGLEKTVSKYQDKKLNQKADALMTNFAQEYTKYDFSAHKAELDQILKQNEGKAITPELVETISANLTKGLDNVTSHALDKDLKKVLSLNDKYKISNETLKDVRNVLKENFKQLSLSEEELAKIIPDNDSIINAFKEKGLLNTEAKEFSEHSKLVQSLMQERIDRFVDENAGSQTARKLNFYMKKIIHSQEHINDGALVKAFKFEPASVLNSDMIKSLRSVSDTLNTFKAKHMVLDRYAFMKVAQAPETSLANSWNETAEVLLKTLKFTPEEIMQAKYDGEISGAILRNKFEEVVSNKETYSAFIESMEKQLSTLKSKFSSIEKLEDEMGYMNKETKNSYTSCLNSTYTDAAEGLRKSNMVNTIEALTGRSGNTRASARDLQLSFIADRVKGVMSSFYRLLNMADVYYKIANVEGLDILNGLPREVKEEAVELAKQIMLDAHSSDYAVKFYQRRNPEPNKSDYSQIETEAGKVINRYFGKKPASQTIELANDRNFFEVIMKLLFDGNLSSITDNKVKTSIIYEDFKNYRRQSLELLGCDPNFAKRNFLVNGKEIISSSESKFLLTGCAPDELFLKLFNQSYNSKKWFSMFGKLGAGLIGVTLLSQLFMGYMKKPRVKKEVK